MTRIFPWESVEVPKAAVVKLALDVRADEQFLTARHSEIERIVTQYVDADRAEQPYTEAPDAKTVRARHEALARALEKSAQSMHKVIELVTEERALGGPLHSTLFNKLQPLPLDDFERIVSACATFAERSAKTIRSSTLTRAEEKSRKRKSRGRRREEGFREFVTAMAQLCLDADGQLYGGNAKRAHRLAQGLAGFLRSIPGAPKKSVGAIEEIARRVRQRTVPG